MITQNCKHLKEFVGIEKDVILRHIQNHKWYREIGDYNEGVADFIECYGWLMRDMYCTAICEYREDCNISRELRNLPDDTENIDVAS